MRPVPTPRRSDDRISAETFLLPSRTETTTRSEEDAPMRNAVPFETLRRHECHFTSMVPFIIG